MHPAYVDKSDSSAPSGMSKGQRPATDANGVDLTFIRATLAMTPTERLQSLENALNALATVRPLPPRE